MKLIHESECSVHNLVDSVPQRKPRKNVYDILFGGRTGRFAIVAVLASFVLPPDGIGINLCTMKHLFDLPCPGCGLTRSVTCLSHLELTRAWHYHPFGFLIYPFMCLAALSVFTSEDTRRRMRVWFWKHSRMAYAMYCALIAGFLIYGFVRLGCALYGAETLAHAPLQGLM